LLETYGYLAVLLLVGLESLGIPLPGETALRTASAYAAAGHLSIVGVVVAATVGAIVGDAGAYWIGRTGGLALVRRYGRFLRLDDTNLERAQRFFQRHGGKTVFLGRFVSLLRMLAALLAGVTRMPYGRFTLYNVAGGFCWALLFGSLGYAFGRRLPQLEHSIGQAGLMIALLGALIVALVLAGRWVADHAEDVVEWLSRMVGPIGASPAVRRMRERHPRAWSFVAARFRTEYLGLHLTIGMGLSLGALWLFGGVAEDIIHHDPLTQFDLTIADALHRHASPTGVMIAKVASFVGSPVFIAALGLVLVGVLLVRRQYPLLVGWVVALAGGSLLDVALKHLFHRTRPSWDLRLLTARGWSFPSGHAMGSLVAYGMLAYILVREVHARRQKAAVITGAIVLTILIGLSRLYLGVHYFSDVIGGYAAGVVWLTACISGLEIVRRRPEPARAEQSSETGPAG
jgi:membrane protein DedA with SNARE-associated domain/membrane-associated phospholipid phosphatase